MNCTEKSPEPKHPRDKFSREMRLLLVRWTAESDLTFHDYIAVLEVHKFQLLQIFSRAAESGKINLPPDPEPPDPPDQ